MKLFSGFSLFKLTAAFWILNLLTGCSLAPAQAITPREPLRVEFTEWWGDYTIIIAQEKGFFEKYGVAVQPVFYPVFSRALPDLAAGQIDGGLFAIGDAINVSKYADLNVVAVYDNGSYNTVVSVPEIKRIRDLTGKRIGVPIGTSYELVISQMLTSVGMRISDVTLVNMDPEDVPANLGKTIDAGFVYEPYASEATAAGNTLLLQSTEFVGIYPDVIVFRANIVKEREEDIRAFLKAWFEAVEYRRQNPNETLETIARYFGKSVDEIAPDESLEILDLQGNYEIFQAQPVRKLSIYETARLNANFLVRMGVLPDQPNLDTLLTPAYLP